MYTYTHTHMNVYAPTHTHTHTQYIYECVYVCVYIHVCVCVYAYIYIHRGPDDKKVGDFDFSIVSLSAKAIIHVEVKRYLNEDVLKKATEQLEKAESYFLKAVPFPAFEGWRYLKFVYFEARPEDELAKICQGCQSHLLSGCDDFGAW